MTGRNVVQTGRHPGADKGNERRVARQIRAHVGDEVDLEREKAVIGVEREFCGGEVVAALRIGKKMFAPVGHPFDWPFEFLGRHRGERIFAIGEQFRAEPAAHIGRHHPHFVGRDLEHVGTQNVAHRVAALAAEREREARAVEFGNHGAGVEVVGGDALVHERQRYRARRVSECARGLVGIADRCLERDVAPRFRPHQRRVFRQRRTDPDHMRQRLPGDRHRLGGIACAVERVGHHEGHRIADMAHLVAREHRIGRHLDPGSRDLRLARQVAKLPGVGASEHQRDTRHGAHLRCVSNAKARMRVRRAHHHGIERARGRVVGDIAAAAAQQRVVLLARHRLTDSEFDGCHAQL